MASRVVVLKERVAAQIKVPGHDEPLAVCLTFGAFRRLGEVRGVDPLQLLATGVHLLDDREVVELLWCGLPDETRTTLSVDALWEQVRGLNLAPLYAVMAEQLQAVLDDGREVGDATADPPPAPAT